MTRKVTVAYELPEGLFQVLEQRAAAEGVALEAVIAEHLSRHRQSPRRHTSEEVERRKSAFERHIGEWDSGDATSSENERIDADLAREYDGCGTQVR
jgi:hypothetical protein